MTTGDAVNFIEHFGVKGQKWGVRKQQETSPRAAAKAEKKLAKADAKWNRQALGQYFKAYNAAAIKEQPTLAAINNKPQYKGKDFRRESPLRDKYYKEVGSSFEKRLNEEATSMFGSSPSGKYKVDFVLDDVGEYPKMYVVEKDISHIESDPIQIELEYDPMGLILGFVTTPTTLAQSEDFVVDFLEHHGIKGQKWGVRRKSKDRAKKQAEDLSKLSTQELRDRVARMQLEQQYSKLTRSPHRKLVDTGTGIAGNILKEVGKQHAKSLLIATGEAAVTIATGAFIAKKMVG